MTRPTEDASFLFDTAQNSAGRATVQEGPKSGVSSTPYLMAHAIYCIAQGLSALSTGLRATYIKLEEVEAQIRKQR